VERSRQRYGMLLLALGVTFFFEGVATPSDAERTVRTALVGATLLLALYAAELSRRLLTAAAVLVTISLVGVVNASIAGQGKTVEAIAGLVSAVLLALAPPAVVRGIVRNFRATGAVTVTVVAGALCLYLLAGLFFGSVYVVIQNLGGGSFFSNGEPATTTHALYFSFITMTTVGYGDFTPRTNLGRTLAASEALLGQIYLVTVVAVIVGRMVPRRMARQ
jgi:hypothetical protein